MTWTRHHKRPHLRVPEAIEGVIDRTGESRFAPHHSPIARRIWREAVGPRIAERAEPTEMDRGVLTIRAATSVWATELSLLSSALLDRLRSLGVPVTALRFRVGPIDEPARPVEPRPSRRVPSPAPLPTPLAEDIEGVGDDDLRRTIVDAARANLAWQSHVSPAGPSRHRPRHGTPPTTGKPPGDANPTTREKNRFEG
jgi:hypothetical protein